MTWYVRASGSVSDHSCSATYLLRVWGDAYTPPATTGGQSIPGVTVWKTANAPNQGSTIDGDWVKMMGPTDRVLRKVYTDDECDGTAIACACLFPDLGGWEKAMISIRVDVEVDMETYCTTGTNIDEDMCHNYIDGGTTISTTNPSDSESKSVIPRWVWWVVGAAVAFLILAALGGLGYYLVNKNKGADTVGG